VPFFNESEEFIFLGADSSSNYLNSQIVHQRHTIRCCFCPDNHKVAARIGSHRTVRAKDGDTDRVFPPLIERNVPYLGA
jgi:hypothetical protein